MTAEHDIIKLEHVYKSFNGLKVLRDVNLDIKAGEITVILGRSGGGKSVLLKHFLGLLLPDQGQVLVDGHNLAALSEKAAFSSPRTFRLPFPERRLV